MKDHHPDTEPAQFKQDKTSGKQIRADRQAWLTLDARTAFAVMPDYSRYLDDDHEKLEEDFAEWISQHYWIVTQLFKEFLHAENNTPQPPQTCGDTLTLDELVAAMEEYDRVTRLKLTARGWAFWLQQCYPNGVRIVEAKGE